MRSTVNERNALFHRNSGQLAPVVKLRESHSVQAAISPTA
jgi:hypothetical protein